MTGQHAVINLHSKWTRSLNDAAADMSFLTINSVFRNSVIREYIWGGMNRTLRYMLPPPAWDMDHEAMSHDEEVELWREQLLVRKRVLMQKYIRDIRRSSIPLPSLKP